MSEKVRITASELKALCTKALQSAGVKSTFAEIVADALVHADSRGVHSHGVTNLPVYVNRIRQGGIAPNAEPTVKKETATTISLDGQGGLGQVAAYRAQELVAAKAAENGLAAATVSNSNHCGALAYYSMKLAEGDMIGLSAANANPNMAPFGGKDSILGTNPLCIAVPSKEGYPVVLDMATSVVSKGKIYLAKKQNREIPTGWALDENGTPTTNPDAALRGSLLPVGGPKGYALAMIVDILAGVLSGGCFGKELQSLHREAEKVQGVGFFILALKVGAFLDVSGFKERLAEMIRDIKSVPPQEGVDEIYVPGEIEYRLSRDAAVKGIELDARVVEEIKGLRG